MMVEEETVGGVERSNLLHVLSIKFEVEEIQILLHSFLVNGLRDDDYIALQQPAQGYLCSSLAIFLADALCKGNRSRYAISAHLLHGILCRLFYIFLIPGHDDYMVSVYS